MSVVVHDWILDRVLPDEKITDFTPNGQTTASGIPVGEIKTTTIRVVEATRVVPYGGTSSGGGGYTISGTTGALTIAAAGGVNVTIQKLTGGDTPGEGGFILSETCEGVVDMILGLYRFRGVFRSKVDESVVGGWAG